MKKQETHTDRNTPIYEMKQNQKRCKKKKKT